MTITTYTTCFELDLIDNAVNEYSTLEAVIAWHDVRSITKRNDDKSIRLIFTSSEIHEISIDNITDLNGNGVPTQSDLYIEFRAKKHPTETF